MIAGVPYRVGRLAFVACVVVAMLVLTSWAHAAAKGVIVFVTPAGEALDAALRDALSAQLSGGVSDVVFEHFTDDASSLRKQVTEARTLSAKYSSQGVFWLDAPVEKDWLLYLAEPSGDRVLVRRITVEAEGAAAATEAVAVITSESVNALAHGSTIGMQPVVIPPELPTGPPPVPEIDPFAPPKPVPPPPPRPTGPRGGFASLGYYGDEPAKEVAWQSGARIEIGDRFPRGLFVGAGYTFFREIDIRTPDVSFRVTRTPIDLDLGWVLDRPGFRVGVGARTVLELLTRENVASGTGLAALPTSTRPLFRLVPSVRLEQELRRNLGVFIVAGIDVALNPFSFVYQADSGDLALLRPSRVRPMVEAGAVLFL